MPPNYVAGLVIELRVSLTKKQSEFERAVEKYPYVCYAGSKGSGKSAGLRLIMLKRRIQYPGSTGYIFRKTYGELERNHIGPLFSQFPDLRPYYNDGKKALRLPNGSELRFAFVEHKRDLGKFQGLDTQDLAIEEAGEWLFEHYEYLDTQKRSAKKGIPARTLLTGNPGGHGHSWIKRLFITRKYRGAEKPENYHFVRAMVEDNPFIMKYDPEYLTRLDSIQNETLRRAFRYGDWDVSAGTFFADFDRSIHVVKPFDIPSHWKRYWGYDFGFNHPTAMVFIAVDEDGNCYVYREYCKPQTHLSDQAAWLKGLPEFKKLPAGLAGRDCWAQKFSPAIDKNQPDQGPTIAEIFQKQGISLLPANVARIQGWNQIRDYLRFEYREIDGERTRIGPRLYFFENCDQTIEGITRLTHDPDNVEDVLKVDADHGDPYTGDDLADALRHVVMGRPSLSTKPTPKPKDAWADAFAETSRQRGSWRTA